jgi:Tol biopolymer transport system component
MPGAPSFRLAFVLVPVVFASAVRAQEPMERVNLAADGGWSNGGVNFYSSNTVSDDGRYVVFSSPAPDLVSDDLNSDDIFIRDRVAGTNLLASVATDGTQGNHESIEAAMSGDGRFVAFMSYADNLVANDTNARADIFLRDRDPDENGVFDEGNATTIRVSRNSDGSQSTGHSEYPAISRDGRIIAFMSTEALTSDDAGGAQIYAYDRVAGTIELVSVDSVSSGGRDSIRPSVSDDGSFVAFESRDPYLVSGDRRGFEDVFVRDRVNGVTNRLSVGYDGSEADGDSFHAAISGEGRFVAFASDAHNLVTQENHYFHEVYVAELATGAVELVSKMPDGSLTNGDSERPVISQDGTLIAFATTAGDYFGVAGTWVSQVILIDRSTGTFDAISADCIGFASDKPSLLPAISADGRFVTFVSRADNLTPLVPSFDQYHLYLRDRSIAWPEASRTLYGSGWPGTKGVPSIGAAVDPEFGATVALNIGNSWGRWTVGFLFLGFAKDSIVTSKGGTILVDPFQLLPIAIGPGGATMSGDVPLDPTLCGLEVDLQAIEQDPGAAGGIAFTAGLELIVGR